MKTWKSELFLLIILANVVFLAAAVWSYWPSWWLAVNSDRSPRAWFFSVQLAAIGFASLLCLYLSRAIRPGKKSNFLWLLMGAGFLYLSLDKHFRLHETIRDRFFVPHNIATRIPGILPGDVVPLIYAAGGIALSWGLVTRWKSRKNWFLYLAIVLAAAAVALDIGNFMGEPNDVLRKMQFTEKLLQTGAQILLLLFVVEQNCNLLEDLSAHG